MPTAQDINSMTNTVYEQHSDNLIVSTPNIHHSTMPNSSPDTSFNSSLSPCGIHDSGSHRLSDSAPHLSSSRPGSIGTSRSNLYVNEETMESTNHPSHHHTQNEGYHGDAYISNRSNISRSGFNGNYIRNTSNTSPQQSPVHGTGCESVDPTRTETVIPVNKSEVVTPPQHQRVLSQHNVHATESPSVRNAVANYERSERMAYSKVSHRQEQLMKASKENLSCWIETDLDDVQAKKINTSSEGSRSPACVSAANMTPVYNQVTPMVSGVDKWTVSNTKNSTSYVKVDHLGNQPPQASLRTSDENLNRERRASGEIHHNQSLHSNIPSSTSKTHSSHVSSGILISPTKNTLVLSDTPPSWPPPSPPTTQSSTIHVQLNPMTTSQKSIHISSTRTSPEPSQPFTTYNSLEQPEQYASPTLPPKLKPYQPRPQYTEPSVSWAPHTNGSTSPHSASPKNDTVPQVTHVRQKSQEEIDYERQAQKLKLELTAQSSLADTDKEFCEVIAPSSRMRTTSDYMTGIFDTHIDLDHHSVLMPNLKVSPRRGSGAKKYSFTIQDEAMTKDDSKDSSAAINKQKEDLIERLKLKIQSLTEDKEVIEVDEIRNDELGTKVTCLVEEKCSSSEFDKYKRYVNNMEQVVKLLLILSSNMADADNKLLDLPASATNRERSVLQMNHDRAAERHEEAKEQKSHLDKNKEQVATYLHKHMTNAEYEDYQHYIKMKSRLQMEKHEIQFKISQSDEQLEALQKSLDLTDT